MIKREIKHHSFWRYQCIVQLCLFFLWWCPFEILLVKFPSGYWIHPLPAREGTELRVILPGMESGWDQVNALGRITKLNLHVMYKSAFLISSHSLCLLPHHVGFLLFRMFTAEEEPSLRKCFSNHKKWFCCSCTNIIWKAHQQHAIDNGWLTSNRCACW